MPRYSLPLPFRRGRAMSRPRTCTLAGALAPVPSVGVADVRSGGVPRPTPRVAAAYVHAGRRRVPRAGVADGRGRLEDGRGGGMRLNGGFQSRL